MTLASVIFAVVTMTPSFSGAPVPCETEDLSFAVAKWERRPQDSRWVRALETKWTGATSPTATFKRPWRWYFRRTALRFEGVAADLRLTVNGRAVGETKGEHAFVEFDLTDHLKWFGDNEFKFELGPTAAGVDACRQALLVSTHRRAPRDLRVETWLADDFRKATFKVLDEKGAVLKERELPNPVLWSDEIPAVCLTPIEFHWGWWIFGGTEYRSVKFGFKKTEIKDGQVLINGRPARFHALAQHKTTPGFCGQPTTARKFVQDLTFIKNVNANAVFASDYPKSVEWYELCDRDGVYVIAGEDEDVPPGRPCVVRLPAAAMPKRVSATGDAQALTALRRRFAPVKATSFDWNTGNLAIENDYRFCDLDKLDGVAWRSFDAAGKVVAKGPLAKIKLAPGKAGSMTLSGVIGEKLKVEFVFDDDAVAEAEFTKGK